MGRGKIMRFLLCVILPLYLSLLVECSGPPPPSLFSKTECKSNKDNIKWTKPDEIAEKCPRIGFDCISGLDASQDYQLISEGCLEVLDISAYKAFEGDYLEVVLKTTKIMDIFVKNGHNCSCIADLSKLPKVVLGSITPDCMINIKPSAFKTIDKDYLNGFNVLAYSRMSYEQAKEVTLKLWESFTQFAALSKFTPTAPVLPQGSDPVVFDGLPESTAFRRAIAFFFFQHPCRAITFEVGVVNADFIATCSRGLDQLRTTVKEAKHTNSGGGPSISYASGSAAVGNNPQIPSRIRVLDFTESKKEKYKTLFKLEGSIGLFGSEFIGPVIIIIVSIIIVVACVIAAAIYFIRDRQYYQVKFNSAEQLESPPPNFHSMEGNLHGTSFEAPADGEQILVEPS